MDNKQQITEFLNNGYIVVDVANRNEFNSIQSIIIDKINHACQSKITSLDKVHDHISFNDVNRVRLHTYNELNKVPSILEKYFSIFEPIIYDLLGTELASQNKINLNIQMPNDENSRLSMHTDTVSGQSEFEIVAWLPLTPVFSSNSMFIFDLRTSQEMILLLPEYHTRGMDELFEDWESTLMHGNRINRTNKSRVSLNARFKALFSPYNQIPHSEKKIGNFYKPLRISPVTELALKYKEPNGKF